MVDGAGKPAPKWSIRSAVEATGAAARRAVDGAGDLANKASKAAVNAAEAYGKQELARQEAEAAANRAMGQAIADGANVVYNADLAPALRGVKSAIKALGEAGRLENSTGAIGPETLEMFNKDFNVMRKGLADLIWKEPGDAGVQEAAGKLNKHLEKTRSGIERMQQVAERSRKELPQHTVKPGETLSSLAQGLNRDWKDIYDLNKQAIGSDPNRLTPGTKLRLPTKKDEATAMAEAAVLSAGELFLKEADAMQAQLKQLGQAPAKKP